MKFLAPSEITVLKKKFYSSKLAHERLRLKRVASISCEKCARLALENAPISMATASNIDINS